MFLARKTLRAFFTAPLSFQRRGLSSRASTVLSALDIPTTPTELPGVYDGEWKGSGDVFQSVCPTTGEVLAHVKSVKFLFTACRFLLGLFFFLTQVGFGGGNLQASPAELHGALERAREAYVYFRSVPAPRRGEVIRQIREALAAKVRCAHATPTPPRSHYVA
jgi:aldehyde dehydrogenase family 7 member A1